MSETWIADNFISYYSCEYLKSLLCSSLCQNVGTYWTCFWILLLTVFTVKSQKYYCKKLIFKYSDNLIQLQLYFSKLCFLYNFITLFYTLERFILGNSLMALLDKRGFMIQKEGKEERKREHGGWEGRRKERRKEGREKRKGTKWKERKSPMGVEAGIQIQLQLILTPIFFSCHLLPWSSLVPG